jgi:hypothetical protein
LAIAAKHRYDKADSQFLKLPYQVPNMKTQMDNIIADIDVSDKSKSLKLPTKAEGNNQKE